MSHHHRHCVYCGKLSGDARTCVKHAPLVLIDPYFAPFWSVVRRDGRNANAVRVRPQGARVKPERISDELPRHMEEGSFEWCVDRLDLGDFDLTRIAKGVCLRYTTWPDQLLGRGFTNGAVSPNGAPLSTGPCEKPSLEPNHVHCRRLLWRLGYLLTDLSIENIAHVTGGYSVAYVRPWATSWKRFEEHSGPTWWPSDRLWIRRLAEPMGVRPEDLP